MTLHTELSRAPSTRAAGGAWKRDLTKSAYAYDGAGNRREVTASLTSAGGDVKDLYTVNEVNEYIRVGPKAPDPPAQDPVEARVYDNNGNLKIDRNQLYFYDYKNRLVKTQTWLASDFWTYTYFADGRRSNRTYHAQGDSVTRFVHDGDQEIEERNGADQVVATFVWAPDYVDDLAQFETSAGRFYVHQDARHNVVAVTDVNGDVVDKIRYDDFGRSEHRDANGNPHRELDGDLVEGSPIGLAYGFQGRRHEGETGFVYFRARHYDPETGRFIQRDPEDDPANAANQYTFVGNDPATSLDPTGRITAAGVADWLDKNIVDPGVKFAQSVIELFNFRTGLYPLDYAKSAAVGWAQGIVELYGNLFKGFVTDTLRVGQAINQGIDEWERGERWEATKSFGIDALRAIGLFVAGVKAVRLLQPGFLRIPPKLGCFLAGTMIETVDGSRRIEDIEVGDRVLSRDERTGEQGFKRVTRLFRGQTDRVVYLRVAKAGAVQRGRSEAHSVGNTGESTEEVEPDSTQQIRCTTEHPFWVEQNGWISAGDLVVGDVLSSADGQPLLVVGREVRQEAAAHFNFEVEDWHTYFVAGELILLCRLGHLMAGAAGCAGLVDSGERHGR